MRDTKAAGLLQLYFGCTCSYVQKIKIVLDHKNATDKPYMNGFCHQAFDDFMGAPNMVDKTCHMV